MFTQVAYPKPQRLYVDGACPRCGEAKVYESAIPCPDGRPGCLVLHRGYICDNCNAILQSSEEERGVAPEGTNVL
jgi:hypothetical protein